MTLEISPFVTAQLPYLTALMAGALGGVHCLGMCGGVVGALSFGLPAEVREQRARLVLYLLAYNLGRLSTYALLGLGLGWLGAQGGSLIQDYGGWVWLRVMAGALMVAMGLYLSGWWMGLLRVEAVGARLWRYVQPLGRRLLPVQSPLHAWVFGMVWGLLPCGLVYTMLIWALAAGGPWQGAGFLLSFGVGTLLVMLPVGFVSGAGMAKGLQSTRIRQWAGGLVMVFGAWVIVSSLVYGSNLGLGCVANGGTGG